MDFNFYDQYKTLSNVELLKIVRNPAGYQPAAVEAATQLLAEREVPQADIDEAEGYLQEIKENAKSKAEKINAYREKAADFLQPIANPGTEVQPAKWLNILLLVIGLHYFRTFYLMLRGFIEILRCRNCGFDYTILIQLIYLLYIPVIFYLFLEKKRWGWILLFADNIIALILGLWASVSFFKFKEYHYGEPVFFFFILFLRVLFAYFLWRKDIAIFFSVTEKEKRNTLGIAVILALAFIALIG